MDSVKLDLFHDVVFVFTPLGEVKEMPVGSTPVDFAYAIHTEIGDHCVGAKINGKLVPLRHRLSSGDMLEILTSPSQVPHKGWLKFVRTSRAKAKIRHWFKVEEHNRALDIGRRLLEREFRRHGLPTAQTLKSDRLVAIAKDRGFETVDELIRLVGYGRLSASQVLNQLQPPSRESQADEVSGVTVDGEKTISKHLEKSVKVKGGNRCPYATFKVL